MKINENDCSSDEAGTSSAGTPLFVIKVIKITVGARRPILMGQDLLMTSQLIWICLKYRAVQSQTRHLLSIVVYSMDTMGSFGAKFNVIYLFLCLCLGTKWSCFVLLDKTDKRATAGGKKRSRSASEDDSPNPAKVVWKLNAEGRYICDICDKTFKTVQYYYLFINTLCPICEYASKTHFSCKIDPFLCPLDKYSENPHVHAHRSEGLQVWNMWDCV